MYVQFLDCFEGFGAGSFALAAPIYISEIAETSLRGALGSMMQLFLTTGIVYINGLGSVLEWDVLTATVLIFPGTKLNSAKIIVTLEIDCTVNFNELHSSFDGSVHVFHARISLFFDLPRQRKSSQKCAAVAQGQGI